MTRKGFGRNGSLLLSRLYAGIYLKGLKERAKNVIYGNRSLSQDQNRVPLEYMLVLMARFLLYIPDIYVSVTT
jgi:hypothetical protein